jgi:hypothetical protein
MKITNHWVTPIAEFDLDLPEEMRQQLISVLLRKEEDREKLAENSPDFFKFMQSKRFYASTRLSRSCAMRIGTTCAARSTSSRPMS